MFHSTDGTKPTLVNSLLLVFLVTIIAVSCRNQVKDERIIEIKGIYGSPDPFWKKGIRLDSLGVNAIFLSGSALNDEMISRARSEGLKVFAEFPVLNGEYYVEEHPEAWAINDSGKRVRPASWFLGVCPTEPGFRKHRMDELASLLREKSPDGIWMDYVHWHAQFEEPEPILPETCFCDNCLNAFQSETGIKLPEGTVQQKAQWIFANHDDEWRTWRCRVIAGWTSDIRDIIKKGKPGTLLGIYHCPWDDAEYDGARRRILGLDYDMLRDLVDVFSPMVYHGRMGRSPEWVKENIRWFSGIIRKGDNPPGIWPIVQAYDDPRPIFAEEFRKVLSYGLTGASTGIMMFTSNAVAASDEKIRILSEVYNNLK